MCLAVPGRIVRVEERDHTRMADVDFGGVTKSVCLEYLPESSLGDYVMVHVGFAIQRLDEQSALDTLANIKHLGMFEEEFGDAFQAAARQAGLPADGTTVERAVR